MASSEVPKKKWCFGRRDVICLTKDCKYMQGCIQSVYEQRVAELLDEAPREPGRTVPALKKFMRKLERRRARDRKKR